METWANNIIESLPDSVHVLNVSQGITLLKSPSGGHNHAEPRPHIRRVKCR